MATVTACRFVSRCDQKTARDEGIVCGLVAEKRTTQRFRRLEGGLVAFTGRGMTDKTNRSISTLKFFRVVFTSAAMVLSPNRKSFAVDAVSGCPVSNIAEVWYRKRSDSG